MKTLLILLFTYLAAYGNSQDKVGVMKIQVRQNEPNIDNVIYAKVWNNVQRHITFHAPWDKKIVNNTFQCYFSNHYFYFRFEVCDSTPILKEPFTNKMDVIPEDRAEIFLSPTADMKQYYCAEMDPLGNVLDYTAQYPRKFNYPWSFETLQLKTCKTIKGYIVAGRWSLKEWEKLGLNPKCFYMGVFSADFYAPKQVIWFSLLNIYRAKADFHIPEMLFPCLKGTVK